MKRVMCIFLVLFLWNIDISAYADSIQYMSQKEDQEVWNWAVEYGFVKVTKQQLSTPYYSVLLPEEWIDTVAYYQENDNTIHFYQIDSLRLLYYHDLISPESIGNSGWLGVITWEKAGLGWDENLYGEYTLDKELELSVTGFQILQATEDRAGGFVWISPSDVRWIEEEEESYLKISSYCSEMLDSFELIEFPNLKDDSQKDKKRITKQKEYQSNHENQELISECSYQYNPDGTLRRIFYYLYDNGPLPIFDHYVEYEYREDGRVDTEYQYDSTMSLDSYCSYLYGDETGYGVNTILKQYYFADGTLQYVQLKQY